MIDPAAIRTERLANGLTLVTEQIPTVRSVSAGVWVTAGSRDEPAELNGIAHFVEHVLFKGTHTRSTREIAITIDALGGQLDAFTSREHACYYAMVLDQRLGEAIELLADLLRHPRLDADEIERERGVVLEEIAAAEDDPEDRLYETFLASFWRDHPMGRPILGTRETVRSLTPAILRDHVAALAGGDLVVAIAGNLEHERARALVAEAFGDLAAGGGARERRPPRPSPHFVLIPGRGLEQAQLYVACEAPSERDPRRYAAQVLNTVLGGGVSSRLFQAVREERGLAYNVYSSVSAYSDCGHLWISAGTRPETAPEVFALIVAELEELRARPLEPQELRRIKDHLAGALMLGLENTFGRMANLARQQMDFGRVAGLDEILGAIETVTAEQVHALACEIFTPASLSAGVIAGAEAIEELAARYADGLQLAAGARVPPRVAAPLAAAGTTS